MSISATKSATGHLLGAAGAIATIFAIQALREGTLPPTLNLTNPDEDAARFHLPTVATQKQVSHAMFNAFGFGGVNASLVVSRVPS